MDRPKILLLLRNVSTKRLEIPKWITRQLPEDFKIRQRECTSFELGLQHAQQHDFLDASACIFIFFGGIPTGDRQAVHKILGQLTSREAVLWFQGRSASTGVAARVGRRFYVAECPDEAARALADALMRLGGQLD